MRNLGYQPLAALAAPVATCHVGLSPGLVDEHQARRVNLALVALPLRPPPGHVRSILLAGVLAFLKLMPSCAKKCQTAKQLTLMPRPASSPRPSAT
jgi:hypothetical protein